ncbi:hypothetical protein EC988_008872 [Linderina pennispora]|nr:hypothetical protein EC988_008872 [Linderina pennispora]
MLGHSRTVDPNTFQALPVDRLLQRVCSDVSANVRAHLRTATGCYDLFDIHVYVGAVGSSSQLSLDDVYFVCRISKFDALSCAPRLSNSLLPRIAMPTGFSPVDSISEIDERPTKRQRVASPSDALYMLATVTDSDASSNGNSPRSTPVHSTSASSPVLASPSPMARSPHMTNSLPPLSDLLKSMDKQFLPRPSF